MFDSLIDGAQCQEYDSYERIVRMFDGHNEDSVNEARECWKKEKELGHKLTYWQQNDKGQFSKKES